MLKDNVPPIRDFIDHRAITPPTNPQEDHVKVYMTANGTSPNKEIAWKLKFPNGEEAIIASMLV